MNRVPEGDKFPAGVRNIVRPFQGRSNRNGHPRRDSPDAIAFVAFSHRDAQMKMKNEKAMRSRPKRSHIFTFHLFHFEILGTHKKSGRKRPLSYRDQM